MVESRKPFRIDESAAAEVLSKLIPENTRERVAQVFGASCRHAHVQSPACWDLTLDPSFVRLNVGQVALLDIKGGELFLCVVGPLPDLPRGIRVNSSKGPVYAAVPVQSVGVHLALRNVRLLDDRILSAHLRYITEAASRKRVSPWHAAHSPAAVRVFGSWSGARIPQPSYVTGAVADVEIGQSEIRAEVEEFAASPEIEQVAVRVVREWYEHRGWRVLSVEADRVGYDLRCSKNGETCHVEVKGRARCGDIVLLTANEWRCAVEDPQFVMAVVSEISAGAPSIQQSSGADFQRSHQVTPIVYRAARQSDRARANELRILVARSRDKILG